LRDYLSEDLAGQLQECGYGTSRSSSTVVCGGA